MRILVVEDDQEIADNIQNHLKKEGFVAEIALDGEDGEFRAMEETFDVIILDINLPYKDGFEIIKSIRTADISTPVIMLTAYSDIEHRVTGLQLGADDYLPKPFSMDELTARVHALIRRSTKDPSPTIKVADLEIDPQAHTIKRGEIDIELPAKEFSVLEFLARNKGNVVTRTMILDHVWGSEFETLSNVVDVYIKNLRNKIDHGFDTKLIHTIRGKGYALREEKQND